MQVETNRERSAIGGIDDGRDIGPAISRIDWEAADRLQRLSVEYGQGGITPFACRKAAHRERLAVRRKAEAHGAGAGFGDGNLSAGQLFAGLGVPNSQTTDPGGAALLPIQVKTGDMFAIARPADIVGRDGACVGNPVAKLFFWSCKGNRVGAGCHIDEPKRSTVKPGDRLATRPDLRAAAEHSPDRRQCLSYRSRTGVELVD